MQGSSQTKAKLLICFVFFGDTYGDKRYYVLEIQTDMKTEGASPSTGVAGNLLLSCRDEGGVLGCSGNTETADTQ